MRQLLSISIELNPQSTVWTSINRSHVVLEWGISAAYSGCDGITRAIQLFNAKGERSSKIGEQAVAPSPWMT